VTSVKSIDRRRNPRGRVRGVPDLLYATLRLIGKHIKGFWGAILAYLTVGVIVGLIAVAIFAAFAAAVQAGWTQTIDERTLSWLQARRAPALDKIMLTITTLGDGVVRWMVVFVASLFLWLTRHHWSVYMLFIALVGGILLNQALKGAFNRPRPSVVVGLDPVTSLSFPSGHAMVSLITYGTVAYLVGRLEPTPRLRTLTWLSTALVVLGIGLSRMYLGVHYPSDVLAGFIAGVAWLAFVASGMTALQYFAPRRPETRKEERGLVGGTE
jgi:undecaprenyl-diphosphatase